MPKTAKLKEPKRKKGGTIGNRNAAGHGRPSKYTQELGKEICDRLSNGESLTSICRADRMPSESNARAWAKNPQHPFSADYIRAREIAYMKMADEVIEISDDGSNDWMRREGKEGDGSPYAIMGEHVQRSRLRVDARKWILSKMLPKVFGDRQEITGKDGKDLIPATAGPADLAKALLDVFKEFDDKR